ncbi:MAG TPA: sugar phosphate isomerase/epimerase, partial [Clostridiales bacterium]|nr:sugar phosphate isomerase/epimerase [Clostridiales bacterium]
MSLPVALQLYSVRTELKQDFYGVLEQVKAMGYDGVEFAGLMGENPEKVKKALGSLGLTALSAHVPLADFLADTTGVLKELKQLGVQYAVVPYLPPQRRPNGGDFEETIRQIRQVGEAVASSGLMLLYHNHDFEFVKIDGQYALDMLYDAIPASLLQTELDTCWVRVGGEDPVAYLKKYTGRAPVVHIKDYVGEKSENMYELIGIQS